jgi:putative FmdB family regulatory protein
VPIYEYKCDNDHVFDVIQKMVDEPLTECQECGAPAVRILHSPAVHFKGSGFYNTDYGKKKKGGNGAASSEGGSSGGEGSSEGGSSNSSSNGDSSSSSAESKSSDSKPKAAAAD